MSRRRSHSPSYRNFLWEEPDFEPQKMTAPLDRMPMGQGEGNYWEEEERRHPHYQQHMQHSEEAYHRRNPSHEPAHFDGRNDGHKRRYEDRRGPPQPEYNRNYAQRDPGWRQDHPGRESRERFRDRSPINQAGNWPRGRGTGQQRRRAPIHTDTWTPSQDNPDLNRNREMDDSLEFGYGWEKPYGQRFAADGGRDEYDRNTRGLLKFKQKQNDPMEVMPPPRREQCSRSRERDFPPKPRNSRSLSREDKRGGHFVENRSDDGYHEASRSPITPEGPTFAQYTDRAADRGKPANRGRGFNQRAGFNRRGRGRGAPNNLPKQRRENAPNEPQRSLFMEEEFNNEPEPAWEDREPDQAWRDDRPSVEGRRGDGGEMNIQRQDLEMQRPQELRGRNEPKPNMMVVTEETLTIKVDMSRPVNKNSAMLYSADRQLSLDLVHVGRQRLDFLSTAENLGANRENTVQHTGTFAQEIITLTHLVKDLYFGGECITLNERFSVPQRGGGYDDDKLHELTLSERFSANRLKVNSNMDSNNPLFMSQGPLQLLGSPMVRDPDDLRHDLEKRRQERLDGVKVTIAGQTRPQHPQLAPPVHKSEPMYSRNDKVVDEVAESNWPDEPHTRREGPVGPRRGGPFRPNAPFRRNNRQMRRPNYRRNNSSNNNNNNGGPNW